MTHAILWIDKEEARIFDVSRGDVDHLVVHSPRHHLHRHPKDADTRTRNHPEDEHRFFADVARALAADEQILLVGPSMTKLHFFRYVQKREPALEARIVGIESADHPTDGQLVAHSRRYFHEMAPRHERG